MGCNGSAVPFCGELSPDCALSGGLHCYGIATNNTVRSAEFGPANLFCILIVNIIIIIILYLVYTEHEVEKKRALLFMHVPVTAFCCYIKQKNCY